MYGQATIRRPIAVPNACVVVDMSNANNLCIHNSSNSNDNREDTKMLNSVPILGSSYHTNASPTTTTTTNNNDNRLVPSQYTFNLLGNHLNKDKENDRDKIANQRDIQRNLDDILLKMSSLQKKQQQPPSLQPLQQHKSINKGTMSTSKLDIANISNHNKVKHINTKTAIDEQDIDSTGTYEDKNQLYYDNDTKQTMTLTRELFTQKLAFFNTAIYNIQHDEYEDIKTFIERKKSGYELELQRLQVRENQSLQAVHDMYARRRSAIQEALEQKKQLARNHVLREMNQIRNRLHKYKRTPQTFSLIECINNADKNSSPNNSQSIKIRIQRTPKFCRGDIQTEVKDTFLNWKETLLENKRITRNMASRLNYNKTNSDLQRYCFGLNHRELKEDLSLMLEQYFCECKNEPRATRVSKRKVRKSTSPLTNGSNQTANGWTDTTNAATRTAKELKNKKDSDSSGDESWMFRIYSTMNGLPPLGFLNDPSCTNYQLRKSKRVRKPVASYCEGFTSMGSCEPQEVTLLKESMALKINDYKINIGDRIKIDFLQEDRCIYATLCEIQKNQLFVKTIKHKRLKIRFKDLESGIINIYPSKSRQQRR